MIDSINVLSQMYLGMFTNTPKDKKKLVFLNTINLLDVLLKRDKNFHAICGIVFAFISIGEIEELKKDLDKLNRKRFEFYDNLCLFENNYKNLRDEVERTQKPLLPFMGTISRDIVLANEYNKSKEGSLFNFNKLRIMYNVIMKIIDYQTDAPVLPTDIDKKFHAKFCKLHGLDPN